MPGQGVKLPIEINPRNSLFNYGDHLRDILGPARVYHSHEYAIWMNKAEELGVNVSITSSETLAYSPGLKPGIPGTLILNENASIAAIRHETQHMLDDAGTVFLGFRLMADSQLFWRMEFRAYMQEIIIVRKLKEYDVGRKILHEMRTRKKEILPEYGDISK